MLFTGSVLSCIHMLDVIGAKAYGAGTFEIALIRSGMGLGLMGSYLVATRVAGRRRVPYVVWPQTAARLLLLSLALIPWLPRNCVLPVFCLCAVSASALEHVIHPARLTLYRHNYPVSLRPQVASRVRQGQMLMILIVGAGLGLAMDWNSPDPVGLGGWLGSWLPSDLLPHGFFLKYGVPVVALFSFLGVILFSRIRERGGLKNMEGKKRMKMRTGWRDWTAALFGNRSFLVFECAYFIFGFGNLMTMPLLVVLITKPEYGINASYFEAMLLQTVIWQMGILLAAPFMSRLVGRYNPILLRGIFTLLFSVDLILMFIGYRLSSLVPLYLGKALRGITMAGGMLIWELGPMYFAKNKEEVPTYVGIHSVLTGVRAFVSPWAGASLAAAFSLGGAILIGAAMQIAAAALLILYFLAARNEPLRLKAAPGEIGDRQQGGIT